MCVSACVRVCVSACVRVCVRACVIISTCIGVCVFIVGLGDCSLTYTPLCTVYTVRQRMAVINHNCALFQPSADQSLARLLRPMVIIAARDVIVN